MTEESKWCNLKGLCPPGRIPTAFCHPCEMEKILDLESDYGLDSSSDIVEPIKIAECTHGIRIDRHCGCCDMECEPGKRDVEGLEVKKSGGGSSDYYDLPPDCTRLYDIMVKKSMCVDQQNIFKAAYRWDIKPDLGYNLRKIIWFANEALNRLNQSSPVKNVEGKGS